MAMRLEMPKARTTQVVVATSAMLSFISFWRAAAIVLNDLGSSAYYVGGIAEQATGRAATWFIFGVMLFSYAMTPERQLELLKRAWEALMDKPLHPLNFLVVGTDGQTESFYLGTRPEILHGRS